MLEPVLKNVAVILPAAGSAERFVTSITSRGSPSNGLRRPEDLKQFLPVGPDKVPLFIHTIDAFARIPWIGTVVLVIQEQHASTVEDATVKYLAAEVAKKISVAYGGATRHRTIQNGLTKLESLAVLPEMILVHDVVRPFIEETVCRSLVLEAKKYGAAGVFVPLVSTIIHIDGDGIMEDSLPRSEYFASEMPQAFTYSALREAYNAATEVELDNGTECLALVKKYTHCQIKMTPVDPNLYFKVTYAKDILAVEGILKNACGIATKPECEDFVVDARRAPAACKCAVANGDYP